ncbi:bis(5'-nucleosyl)-tetraphosphatase (symmetrical) YqeK [Clostridium thermarum]|uniref:bis(5'-nucleosyl)-tetraphosphatase (symmetrical) YqeK n=1 Tax=Clostridium thermarum TaxID=1716543 RepID=UPI0013D4CBB0|nr:bis(5'-nucleosyl)-tetraphosphatase (symmetrical) YqeK [Clostridium thermarum]
MWNEIQMLDYIRKRLSPQRYQHVLGVRDAAVKLAETYGEDKEKAKLAALIHDCAKNMSDEDILSLVKSTGYTPDWIEEVAPQLLHGMAGAIIAKQEMGIEDSLILDAITYHTTGRRCMTLLDKIIYIADYIEPSRDFPTVEDLRREALVDLDRAMLMSLENTIKYVVNKGQLLHTNTIDARNSLLLSIGKGSAHNEKEI